MKHFLRTFGFLAIFGLIILGISAQDSKPSKYYTVGGVRHGISYFPYVDYPQTRPKVPGEMDFSHYHKYDEVLAFLNRWAKDYPNIVEVYSVGKSFEGRDIWQMTITNKSTGKDTDKPAMFVEGNRHSGEGSEQNFRPLFHNEGSQEGNGIRPGGELRNHRPPSRPNRGPE